MVPDPDYALTAWIRLQQKKPRSGSGFNGAPEVMTGLDNLTQLLHEHHRLDELHVAELRVPVDVGRAHQDRLRHLNIGEMMTQRKYIHFVRIRFDKRDSVCLSTVLRIRIRYPESGASLTPGSGNRDK